MSVICQKRVRRFIFAKAISMYRRVRLESPTSGDNTLQVRRLCHRISQYLLNKQSVTHSPIEGSELTHVSAPLARTFSNILTFTCPPSSLKYRHFDIPPPPAAKATCVAEYMLLVISFESWRMDLVSLSLSQPVVKMCAWLKSFFPWSN